MTNKRSLMVGFSAVAAIGLAMLIAVLEWQTSDGLGTRKLVLLLSLTVSGTVGLLDSLFGLLDRFRKQDTQVIEKLDDLMDSVEELSVPAAPTITPRIAPPVADFTGRDEEMAAMQAQLENGGAICGLRGMGGIGKTELARALAQRLAEDYPDGGLTVELRGTEEPPADPSRALESILRLLTGQNIDPSCTLAERRNLYQGAMQGKKMIVLLDNARDPDQVAPLLPPPPSLAIVTTRNSIVLPRLKMVTLETLTREHASALLLEICERIGAAASAIAQACGCLPLALRLAGGALAGDETLTVQRYLAKLGNQDGTLGFARKALTASYELLAEELKPLWCQLAAFPADFDALGAAAVWERGEDEARERLSDLLCQSLVQYEIIAQRYSLHDLARVYAADRAGSGDAGAASAALESARLRHAQHYVQVLHASNRSYHEGNEGITQGLALFDAEWPNIQAGQAWAAEHVRHGKAVQELVNAYCRQNEILALRQHPSERIVWLTAAAAAARASGEQRDEGRHLGSLGNAYAETGRLHEAIAVYEQRLDIARMVGDRRGEGNALGNLGLTYAALGNVRQAVRQYELRLEIARLTDVQCSGGEDDVLLDQGEKRDESMHMGVLGSISAEPEDLRRVIELYEERVAIARERSDRRGEANALGYLGLACAALGLADRAIALYNQRLDISREIGDLRSEGHTLGNLGRVFADIGQVRRAVECMEQCLALADSLGDRRGEANSHFDLGMLCVQEGEPESARRHLHEALVLFETIESPYADRARQALAELDAPE